MARFPTRAALAQWPLILILIAAAIGPAVISQAVAPYVGKLFGVDEDAATALPLIFIVACEGFAFFRYYRSRKRPSGKQPRHLDHPR
jgi:hypothetical protein